MFSDALGSVGAIAAGLIMLKTRWWYADPAASVFICLIVLWASYDLVRESIHILLEGAPLHLDIEEIRDAIEALKGVSEVHDLHLWSLSSGTASMSGHVVLAPGGDAKAVLKAGGDLLEKRFSLKHVTLQIEHPD